MSYIVHSLIISYKLYLPPHCVKLSGESGMVWLRVAAPVCALAQLAEIGGCEISGQSQG